MAADPMAEIREVFFQECEEQLGELESGLLQMENGSKDAETVNAVFRAVHSIKGGAGIFALDALVRFAHVFETTLDAIRGGRLAADPPIMALLLRAADALMDLVRAARQGEPISDTQTQDLVAEFNALAAGKAAAHAKAEAKPAAPPPPPPAPSGPPKRSWVIRLTPKPPLYAKANETALLLRELSLLGEIEVEVDASGLPDLADIDPEATYLSWNIVLSTDKDSAAIRGVFDFVEDDCDIEMFEQPDFSFFDGGSEPEAEAAPAAPAGGTESNAPAPPAAPNPVETMAAQAENASSVSQTIRVDLDRVDRMIDLVGELVITEAMLSQRVLEAGLARTSAVAMALEELEALTREIQDSVMAIRAQPVRAVFQRMPRLVRELAAHTGKQVRLVTEGESTEVDKTVIERIADPLTHMIRNAIDHGLESTEKRLAAGKSPEGQVRLTALHRSGRIVIEVADDGAGINRARVKQKAIENGLINPDAQLTDDETDNLIFLPGFSTASEISDISGRGVGMDVVRRSVQAMGGRISITSRPGLGSTFTLSLPLTLAVLDGMVVKTSDQTLIVPLAAVLETLRPNMSDIHPLDNRTSVLALRGGYVPMVDVAEALEFGNHTTPPDQCVALLVESEGGNRAILLVDEIQGQRQVVIKSIEANYRAVYGIAAATVMGDGHVALILDVDTIVSATRDSGRTDFNRSISQVF
ncbi:MAG TPA: chemotaxis protein CheA [Acidisoma sp.]|uniref:chemotaxis protein CheA n=1 Tax=Acidisoma sp. TaxID=1872115 RepID=UPI002B69D796|nr:chemotaxis protein CheA [Acidisoma sp.]HTI00234.1 chemotaxis protein CheA [Acidisoma sp.]